MKESDPDTWTTSAHGSTPPRPRRPVADELVELEGRWLMGRLGPRDLYEGIEGLLRLEGPERREELLAAIRARAGRLVAAEVARSASTGAAGRGTGGASGRVPVSDTGSLQASRPLT